MRASNARPYGVDCTSYETVGATIGRPLLAAGAIRLWILPIHLLRQLGYESADETVAVSYRACAIKATAIVGCALPLAASEWLPLEGKLSGAA